MRKLSIQLFRGFFYGAKMSQCDKTLISISHILYVTTAHSLCTIFHVPPQRALTRRENNSTCKVYYGLKHYCEHRIILRDNGNFNSEYWFFVPSCSTGYYTFDSRTSPTQAGMS